MVPLEALMRTEPGYMAFMLRLWRAAEHDIWIWRASLESPHTSERRGFATLREPFAFLESDVGGAEQKQSIAAANERGGEV